jgi:hypothetical protein
MQEKTLISERLACPPARSSRTVLEFGWPTPLLQEVPAATAGKQPGGSGNVHGGPKTSEEVVY